MELHVGDPAGAHQDAALVQHAGLVRLDQDLAVAGHEKLLELVARDGEILIEANKSGVLHKGRVLVRSGRIANVELHPAYSIFP